jgi:cytochrome bd-type quinol oxidase subunit 1
VFVSIPFFDENFSLLIRTLTIFSAFSSLFWIAALSSYLRTPYSMSFDFSMLSLSASIPLTSINY